MSLAYHLWSLTRGVLVHFSCAHAANVAVNSKSLPVIKLCATFVCEFACAVTVIFHFILICGLNAFHTVCLKALCKNTSCGHITKLNVVIFAVS